MFLKEELIISEEAQLILVVCAYGSFEPRE